MIECVYLYAKVRKKRKENSFNSRKRELSLGKRKNGELLQTHRFFALMKQEIRRDHLFFAAFLLPT
jgi:hypothetical protein